MKKLCQCGKVLDRKAVCDCKTSQTAASYQVKQAAYNDRRWKTYSTFFRRVFPLCAHCLREGITTSIHPVDSPGKGCVDHIVRFKDKNDPLFDDPMNHQGLCLECNSKKGQLETAGKYTQAMIKQDQEDRAKQYQSKLDSMLDFNNSDMMTERESD